MYYIRKKLVCIVTLKLQVSSLRLVMILVWKMLHTESGRMAQVCDRHVKLKRKLYKMTIRPELLYGAE